MRLFPAFLAAAVLLGATGCNTFEKRAQEKSATYAALDEPTRDKLKRGEIEIGNTPEMVYIALGAPDRKVSTRSADRDDETWIYNSYYREYAGAAHLGYERTLLYNRRTKRYHVIYEPVVADVYRDEEEERIRIIFRDGQVHAIEQATRR